MVQAVQSLPTFGELSCWEKAVQVQAALLDQRKAKVYSPYQLFLEPDSLCLSLRDHQATGPVVIGKLS
jgi:hypothetical protein